jgi:DNA modification methylase
MTYEEFIRAKMPVAEAFGFEPQSEPHPSLKPHQIDIARWMVRGGRRACFASFGLGKTRINLQVAKWIVEKTAKKYLIVAPLGVRQEFTRSDGPAMGMIIEYCRTDAEVAAAQTQFIITNYERVRDGDITLSPEVFGGAGLDESSILRSYGSDTFQTFRKIFKSIPYRFVFTATPSPNRHKELIHYSDFLGVLDSGDALTRFFKRDSQKAGNLTLLPSQEEKFWLWLSSWAVFMQSPADLGYDATGYDLPPLAVHWHRLPTDHTKAWKQFDSWGQAQLISDQSSGLKELAETKRESIFTRLQFAKKLMAESENQFSAAPPANGIDKVIDEALHHVAGQQVLRELLAGKSWGEAFGVGGSGGPNGHWEGNAKGIHLSGEIIKPKRIMVRVKEYSLIPKKHWLLWHHLEDERRLIEKLIPDVRTIYGSQDLEEREQAIIDFAHGKFPILAAKPSIAGSGCNFQRYCADAIFLGSDYKFNDLIQSIHRIHRYQQLHDVNIHIIYTENEEHVIETLKQKWAQHTKLVAKMTELLKTFKLDLRKDMNLIRETDCDRTEVASEKFRAIRNDNVLELGGQEFGRGERLNPWPDNCIDQIVTSIPFGTQYEYSSSLLDMGHNPDNEGFFKQLDFLIPHLLRVLRPGRIACIHVKDRIRFGNVTGKGMPTVDRFSDKTADRFEKHGFEFMGRITIDTDVVRENNQTYRLGWSENAKDSTKMGVGMPEYVLLFRKLPSDTSTAYADIPVTKDKAVYGRSHWQIDASELYRSDGNRLPDVKTLLELPLDTVGRIWKEHAKRAPYNHAEHVNLCSEFEREGRLPAAFMLFPPISQNSEIWTDIARMRVLNSEQGKRNQENHVCPLQIDIVERLINRYSNPGEIVLDPFAGIFTVPYLAIKMGRIGWGIELGKNYWKCGVGYCEQMESECSIPTLFDLAKTEEAVPA